MAEIGVAGGRGGDGTRTGGDGGNAMYYSQRVINDIGTPVATVSLLGGDGGDVFVSPVPVPWARGGDGGGFEGSGNTGWGEGSGSWPEGQSKDGADGGDILGVGGKGGSILGEAASFPSATGGDGGHSPAEATQLPDPSLLASGGYGLVAGFGGDGRPGCDDGCPGGRGGDSGRAEARGGAGGSAPQAAGGKGGRGGDVWAVKAVTGGVGGEGNPGGTGGCAEPPVVEVGTGGTGEIPGETGEVLYPPAPDQTECLPDSATCGEGLECAGGGGQGPGSCVTERTDSSGTTFIDFINGTSVSMTREVVTFVPTGEIDRTETTEVTAAYVWSSEAGMWYYTRTYTVQCSPGSLSCQSFTTQSEGQSTYAGSLPLISGYMAGHLEADGTWFAPDGSTHRDITLNSDGSTRYITTMVWHGCYLWAM